MRHRAGPKKSVMTVFSDPSIDSVKKLLTLSELAVSDIHDGGPVRFFGCGTSAELVGVIGLEPYGRVGLLRSLAVDASRRGENLGKRLVAHLEHVAAETGLRSIYLLTDTAQHFFLRLGYVRLARDEAPEVIRTTEEFRCLCPDSAVFMVKHIGSEE